LTRTRIFKLLKDRGTTLITMGHLGKRERDDHAANYDGVLELGEGGEWHWHEI
jgi:hypothetical protein